MWTLRITELLSFLRRTLQLRYERVDLSTANGYVRTSLRHREAWNTRDARRDLKSRLHAGCELTPRVGFRVRFLSARIVNRLESRAKPREKS